MFAHIFWQAFGRPTPQPAEDGEDVGASHANPESSGDATTDGDSVDDTAPPPHYEYVPNSNELLDACRASDADRVEHLLTYDHVASEANLHRAFIIAQELGDVRIVDMLLTRQRDHPWFEAKIALSTACNCSNVAMLHMLLDRGHLKPTEGDGRMLIEACEHGHVPFVDRLLQCEALNTNYNRLEALRPACEHGHEEIVAKLLAHGVVVEKWYDGQVALGHAVRNGHERIVAMILSDGSIDPSRRRKAMLYAARQSGSATMESLVKNDARMLGVE